MSKRLVKTAKQQFEERLVEYGLWNEWESQSMCGRTGKVLENGNIVILIHEDDDDKFSEYFYPPFSELRKDDKFFRECLDEFTCHSDEKFVYNMVCWLVYGRTECPLYPLDVYFPANHLVYPESHDFEDIYEEVSDEDPYANTRTQAHKEIEDKGMRMEYESDNGKYYAAEADGKFQVICIWNEGHPTKYTFGESRKKLCESVAFRNAMLMYLALDRDQEEVSKFAAWIKDSTKPEPFDVYDIIEALHFAEGLAISEVYEVNSKIEIDMSPVDEIRNQMIEAIRSKYERGYVVDVMKVRLDATIAYTDGSSCCLEGSDISIYEDKNGSLGLCVDIAGKWEDMNSKKHLKYADMEGFLNEVCVEHLYEILQAMVLPE